MDITGRENARTSVWNPSVAEERLRLYTSAAALIQKHTKIFVIYKEVQMGSGPKS
jgi:hypothetical protein